MNKLAKKYGGKFEKGSLDLEDTFGEPTTLRDDYYDFRKMTLNVLFTIL